MADPQKPRLDTRTRVVYGVASAIALGGFVVLLTADSNTVPDLTILVGAVLLGIATILERRG